MLVVIYACIRVPLSARFLIGDIPLNELAVVSFPHMREDFWLEILNKFNIQIDICWP